MQARSIPLLLLLAASCAGGTAPRPAAPRPAVADAHATAVTDLVGVWSGQAVGTPMGDFPIAIAFDREPDGSVHGRFDDGRGMYLDFRFRRTAGRWELLEEGAIPDVGKQATTLVPAASQGEARWVDHADPSRLAVAVRVTADTMVMTTTMHGEPHAVFQLQRARGAVAERIRQVLAGPRE